MGTSGRIPVLAGFPEGQETQKPLNKRLGEPRVLLFNTTMYFNNFIKTSILYLFIYLLYRRISIPVKGGGIFVFMFPCL